MRSRGRSRSGTTRAPSPPVPAESGSRTRRTTPSRGSTPRARVPLSRPRRSGQGPTAVAVGGGAVWVANTQDGTVSRIDPRTATVTHTIPVGRRPTGVAAGAGAVWVANSLSGTLDRIDPHTMRVESTVEVGAAPQGVTVAHGLVWVSVQRRAPAAAPPTDAPGGIARLVVTGDNRDNRPRARGGPPAHRGHVRDALQLPGPALPGRGDAPAGGGERAAVHLPRRAHVHVQDPSRASASHRRRTSP